jgi:hypothetical protein
MSPGRNYSNYLSNAHPTLLHAIMMWLIGKTTIRLLEVTRVGWKSAVRWFDREARRAHGRSAYVKGAWSAISY